MSLEKILTLLSGIIAMLIPQLKSEESKEGIKESCEMLKGVNEVSLFLCQRLKDGVQLEDATEFYKKLTADEEFKKVVGDAYEGYQKIPAEIKDVDAGEGLELAQVQLDYVPKYVETFKKE